MSEPSLKRRSKDEILADLHNLVHQIEHAQRLKDKDREHQDKKKVT